MDYVFLMIVFGKVKYMVLILGQAAKPAGQQWQRASSSPQIARERSKGTLQIPVLRIRDVYPGFEFFRPGFRIRIKEIKHFSPKNGF